MSKDMTRWRSFIVALTDPNWIHYELCWAVLGLLHCWYTFIYQYLRKWTHLNAYYLRYLSITDIYKGGRLRLICRLICLFLPFFLGGIYSVKVNAQTELTISTTLRVIYSDTWSACMNKILICVCVYIWMKTFRSVHEKCIYLPWIVE